MQTILARLEATSIALIFKPKTLSLRVFKSNPKTRQSKAKARVLGFQVFLIV